MEQSYEKVMEQRQAFMLQLRAHWILEVEEILMIYDEGEERECDDAPKAASREDRLGLPSGVGMYCKVMFRVPMTFTRYPTFLHSLRATHSSRASAESEADQWRSRASDIGIKLAAHIESGTLDGAVKCLAANQSRTDEQLAKMGESLVGLERQMASVIAMLERQGQND